MEDVVRGYERGEEGGEICGDHARCRMGSFCVILFEIEKMREDMGEHERK